MIQTLPTARAELARTRFIAAVARRPKTLVAKTDADNHLLVFLLGTPYGVLAHIDDESIALSIKAPGHQPHLTHTVENETSAIDAGLDTVFDQIATGRLFG
jgi:hypothetical protein